MAVQNAKQLNVYIKDCGYMAAEHHKQLTSTCQEVGRMLGAMIQEPDGFLLHKA
jgi:hypothetical protein